MQLDGRKSETEPFRPNVTCWFGVEHVAGVGAPGVHLGLLPGLPRLVLGFHRFLHLDGPQLEGGVAEGGRVVLAAPGDMPGLKVKK